MNINPDKPYRTEHTDILCVCLSQAGGNSFMLVPPNETHPQYEGAFFALGPTGRIVARDPRLAGLHLNGVKDI